MALCDLEEARGSEAVIPSPTTAIRLLIAPACGSSFLATSWIASFGMLVDLAAWTNLRDNNLGITHPKENSEITYPR